MIKSLELAAPLLSSGQTEELEIKLIIDHAYKTRLHLKISRVWRAARLVNMPTQERVVHPNYPETQATLLETLPDLTFSISFSGCSSVFFIINS